MQWSSEARVATWYVVYKVVLSLIFLGSVAAYYMDVAHYFRWFIFLTNQSLLLLTIHYILDTVLVTSRWAWELLHQGQLCKFLKRWQFIIKKQQKFKLFYAFRSQRAEAELDL